MSKREYKTKGFFVFGDLILGHQISVNGWGKFMHRIARLDGDCETVEDVGASSVYEHPAVYECGGRLFTIMTAYYEDDTSMQAEVIYQLVPPPDSSMALKDVERRVKALMKAVPKTDLAELLGIDKGKVASTPKEEMARRVIRISDTVQRETGT
jgi:hypothetical protein